MVNAALHQHVAEGASSAAGSGALGCSLQHVQSSELIQERCLERCRHLVFQRVVFLQISHTDAKRGLFWRHGRTAGSEELWTRGAR